MVIMRPISNTFTLQIIHSFIASRTNNISWYCMSINYLYLFSSIYYTIHLSVVGKYDKQKRQTERSLDEANQLSINIITT